MIRGHESFVCAPWLISMCAITHSYVCHDSFICAPWPIHTLATTHSYVWQVAHTHLDAMRIIVCCSVSCSECCGVRCSVLQCHDWFTTVCAYTYVNESHVHMCKPCAEETHICGSKDHSEWVMALQHLRAHMHKSLLCPWMTNHGRRRSGKSVLQCVAVCCSVLQCVAVCCSALQCVAACCNLSQCVAVPSPIHNGLYTHGS